MENPLTTLDKIIWSGFDYASMTMSKALVWTKYDCAQRCELVSNGTYAGSGFYMFMQGLMTNDMTFTSVGIGMIGLGFALIPSSTQTIREKEKKELALLKTTGAGQKPKFNPVRPLALLASIYCTYKGFTLSSEDINEILLKLPLEQQSNYESLARLGVVMSGVSVACYVSSLYFQDTTMFPPKKDKNIRARFKNLLKPKPAQIGETVPQQNLEELVE